MTRVLFAWVNLMAACSTLSPSRSMSGMLILLNHFLLLVCSVHVPECQHTEGPDRPHPAFASRSRLPSRGKGPAYMRGVSFPLCPCVSRSHSMSPYAFPARSTGVRQRNFPPGWLTRTTISFFSTSAVMSYTSAGYSMLRTRH